MIRLKLLPLFVKLSTFALALGIAGKILQTERGVHRAHRGSSCRSFLPVNKLESLVSRGRSVLVQSCRDICPSDIFVMAPNIFQVNRGTACVGRSERRHLKAVI